MAVMILGVIMLIAIGLSVVFVTELKTSILIRQSGVAFYAADAGTEFALYQVLKVGVPAGEILMSSPQALDDGAVFWGSWDASAHTIQFTGKYSSVRRRVEVNW